MTHTMIEVYIFPSASGGNYTQVIHVYRAFEVPVGWQYLVFDDATNFTKGLCLLIDFTKHIGDFGALIYYLTPF